MPGLSSSCCCLNYGAASKFALGEDVQPQWLPDQPSSPMAILFFATIQQFSFSFPRGSVERRRVEKEKERRKKRKKEKKETSAGDLALGAGADEI